MYKTKDKMYALYDGDDVILGCFSKDELREMLNTTNKSFDCIICRLKHGRTKALKYKGDLYKVYVYDEVLEECMNG